MSFIRTVLGDIPPQQLGVCYAHEHIIIDPSYTTERYPDFCIDSVQNAVSELTDFFRVGGRAMIDSMPCDCGRNVLKLAEISQCTGVHIVCPTGIHLKKYYPEGHWSSRLSVEKLADLFIADIEQGIDKFDYGGPVCERTKHRAGVLKIASGLNYVNDFERRIFEAAAKAHLQTGAPILTHTEQGTAALQQVEILQKHGVQPRHVVLSHTDRKVDLKYHQKILATGVNVEYDSAFRWKADQGNPTLDLIMSIASEGRLGQVMLGMDAARRSYWKSYGGHPGLTYLLQDFSDTLRSAGLQESDLETIFLSNPRRVYAFSNPSESHTLREL
ncbi:MAG: aryldialkylphosphatase [Planctomycetes bacterium]|nr:aryldialkylphosphatase [Planctomycetota bacterium]